MNIPASALSPRFRGEEVIEFEEKPVPEPGPGQLLLAAKANALCKSDYGAYHKGTGITPGHEMAGVVAAAGPGTNVAVGTRGAVFLMDFCGECRSCRLGITNQCLAKRADYGFTADGGYGPFVCIHENVFFPIPDDVSFAEATLLLDIMGTGGHALKRAQLVHPDIGSVVITGAGPIGLGVLAMTKLLLGRDTPALITDLVPYRLDLAERLGGLPIHIGEESLADGMRRHGFDRVDVAVDGSGRGDARRQALDRLAPRGVLVCVGHGQGLELKVSPDLIGPERAVLGSEYFCYHELAGNLDLLRTHKESLRQILTHFFPVADISEAFRTFTGQQTGKVIVEQ